MSGFASMGAHIHIKIGLMFVCLCSSLQPDPGGSAGGGHAGRQGGTLHGHERGGLPLHVCKNSIRSFS